MSAITTTVQRSKTKKLSTRDKVLIGGLGALTPIILNLLVVDLNTTFTTFAAPVLLTYLIRVGALFGIGGAMAYFHKNEKNALKLFEIGIVAPALLTALMNGTTNVKNPNVITSAPPPAVSAGLMDFLIPTAYAQTDQDIKTYSRLGESVKAQLWRGLSGATQEDDRVWFVVMGTYKISDSESEEKARELVRRIAHSGYKSQIYKNEEYYAVVIGSNLTLAQAKALKEKASQGETPRDGAIYLYNPWSSN